MDSLLRPPIVFAHRGGRAHAPENTLEAFRRALELGASGLESDVRLTADGAPVLDHDGTVRAGVRRRAVGNLARSELPPRIVALEQLYEVCGASYHLSLDVKDARAAEPAVAVARRFHAEERLWLCHPDPEQLSGWRGLSADVRLVNSTRLRRMREGPERRAASLAARGIDAVNLHHTDWTGGLTTLFHRFERYAFGWDCQHDRVLAALLRMGIDAVYSDHVDRMVKALAEHSR